MHEGEKCLVREESSLEESKGISAMLVNMGECIEHSVHRDALHLPHKVPVSGDKMGASFSPIKCYSSSEKPACLPVCHLSKDYEALLEIKSKPNDRLNSPYL